MVKVTPSSHLQQIYRAQNQSTVINVEPPVNEIPKVDSINDTKAVLKIVPKASETFTKKILIVVIWTIGGILLGLTIFIPILITFLRRPATMMTSTTPFSELVVVTPQQPNGTSLFTVNTSSTASSTTTQLTTMIIPNVILSTQSHSHGLTSESTTIGFSSQSSRVTLAETSIALQTSALPTLGSTLTTTLISSTFNHIIFTSFLSKNPATTAISSGIVSPSSREMATSPGWSTQMATSLDTTSPTVTVSMSTVTASTMVTSASIFISAMVSNDHSSTTFDSSTSTSTFMETTTETEPTTTPYTSLMIDTTLGHQVTIETSVVATSTGVSSQSTTIELSTTTISTTPASDTTKSSEFSTQASFTYMNTASTKISSLDITSYTTVFTDLSSSFHHSSTDTALLSNSAILSTTEDPTSSINSQSMLNFVPNSITSTRDLSTHITSDSILSSAGSRPTSTTSDSTTGLTVDTSFQASTFPNNLPTSVPNSESTLSIFSESSSSDSTSDGIDTSMLVPTATSETMPFSSTSDALSTSIEMETSAETTLVLSSQINQSLFATNPTFSSKETTSDFVSTSEPMVTSSDGTVKSSPESTSSLPPISMDTTDDTSADSTSSQTTMSTMVLWNSTISAVKETTVDSSFVSTSFPIDLDSSTTPAILFTTEFSSLLMVTDLTHDDTSFISSSSFTTESTIPVSMDSVSTSSDTTLLTTVEFSSLSTASDLTDDPTPVISSSTKSTSLPLLLTTSSESFSITVHSTMHLDTTSDAASTVPSTIKFSPSSTNANLTSDTDSTIDTTSISASLTTEIKSSYPIDTSSTLDTQTLTTTVTDLTTKTESTNATTAFILSSSESMSLSVLSSTVADSTMDTETTIDNTAITFSTSEFSLEHSPSMVTSVNSRTSTPFEETSTDILFGTSSSETTASQTVSVWGSLLRWNSSGITVAGQTNMSGISENLLNLPQGLVYDQRTNALFIADSNNHRILRWIIGESNGTTVAGQSNGSWGSDLFHLHGPSAAQIDLNGSIYIADTKNHRIVLWAHPSLSGVLVTGNGSAGPGIDQLDSPHGLVLDISSHSLYIADSGNHRIIRYDLTNSSSHIVAGGNGGGTNPNQLFYPVSIYLDRFSNSLIIVNMYGNNLVRWSIGSSSWILLVGDHYGSSGSSSTLLSHPYSVLWDSMGHLLLSDSSNHRIQFYAPNQNNASTLIGLTSISGNNDSLLDHPQDIVFDQQLNLYVADSYNHRIQKFTRY